METGVPHFRLLGDTKPASLSTQTGIRVLQKRSRLRNEVVALGRSILRKVPCLVLRQIKSHSCWMFKILDMGITEDG